MPDTFGKRQRQTVKTRKAAAREERRIARNQRREARAASDQPSDDWLAEPPETEGLGLREPREPREPQE